MQVLLAEEYGFCFGVERAVEMVEGALAEGATVRTLGPLIHNTQEIQRLEVEGVGNPDHPEMIGVKGYAPERAHVVRDASEVANLPPLHAPLVVSQTTLKLSTFLEVAD